MSFAENMEHTGEVVSADDELVLTYIRSGEISNGVGAMTEDEIDRLLDLVARRLGIDQILTDRGVRTIATRDGRRVLYLTARATDALAAMHRIEHETVDKPAFAEFDSVKFFTARVAAVHPADCPVCKRGRRREESQGTVPFPASRDPEEIANAHMHSETKGRRRSTVVVLGFGFIDESEIPGLMAANSGRAARSSTPRSLAAASTTTSAQPANDARDSTAAAPAREPEPTAIDRLADSLAQLDGPLTVDQLVTIWCDHEREITDEAGGDRERIDRADALIRDRAMVPMSKHAFHVAIRVAKACEKEPRLRYIRTALAIAPSLHAIAVMWRDLQPEIAGLDPHHQDLAQQLAVDALRARDPSIAQPKKWLRDALAAPSVARFETPTFAIAADGAREPVDPLAQAANPDPVKTPPESPSANRIAARTPRVKF
jgi:hypothetical protein